MRLFLLVILQAAVAGCVPLLSLAADVASLQDLRAHSEYDRTTPFDVREAAVTVRNGVKVHDLTYRSPLGGLVPAYIVGPEGKGPFAVVLYGH
jgi:hypothetical protein